MAYTYTYNSLYNQLLQFKKTQRIYENGFITNQIDQNGMGID